MSDTKESKESKGTEIKYSFTRNFETWLLQQKVNIIFSSYSNNVVGLMQLKDRERPNVALDLTPIARCMGLYYHELTDKVWMTRMSDIIRLKRADPSPEDKAINPSNFINDVTFHSNGDDIDVHDLRTNKTGEQFYYTSSLMNCVWEGHREKSTTVPWVRQGGAKEDCCHVNGMCLDEAEEKPRYITCHSKSSVHLGWREPACIKDGLIYDLQENRVVIDGLCQPHSPRLYNGQLWVLESGSGYLGRVDIETGKFERKVFLQGYPRGMSFHKNYALITTSMDRHLDDFKNIELYDNLKELKTSAKCGLWIVNMNTFDIVHSVVFRDDCMTELYDAIFVKGIPASDKDTEE